MTISSTASGHSIYTGIPQVLNPLQQNIIMIYVLRLGIYKRDETEAAEMAQRLRDEGEVFRFLPNPSPVVYTAQWIPAV